MTTHYNAQCTNGRKTPVTGWTYTTYAPAAKQAETFRLVAGNYNVRVTVTTPIDEVKR